VVAPHILNIGTRWVVTFTTWSLYSRGKNPVRIWYEVVWTPEPFWKRWQRKIFSAPAGSP